jgi:hypothetical protein
MKLQNEYMQLIEQWYNTDPAIYKENIKEYVIAKVLNLDIYKKL